MRKILAPLLSIGFAGPAMAKDAGMTAPLLAEHCKVEISAGQLSEESAKFSAGVNSALDVSQDEIKADEKKIALEYLKKVQSLSYAKMKANFAKLQKNTNLENGDSINFASKELETLAAELEKADALLNEHSVLNVVGAYDLADFTPTANEVKRKELNKLFEDERKKGIDCGPDVEAYLLQNGKFPGVGLLAKRLLENIDGPELPQILTEAEAFGRDTETNDLETEKAKFVSDSEKLRRKLLVSEMRAIRIEQLIRTDYPNN